MRTSIAALLPIVCLAQAPERPRIALDALRHDFGQVARDSITPHRFKVTNAGGGVLRILKLRPSCGCTSTVLGKDSLGPGESTELEVSFNAQGLKGRALKYIEVQSDDPVQPSLTLTIEAEVKAEVRVLPGEEVALLDLVAGDVRKATIKLESATGQPVHVDDVELTPAPWLGVATREQGGDAYLDLKLVGKRLPPGRMAGTDTVTLYLTNPRPTSVRIRVRWERRLPVFAEPARVALAGPAGQERSATLTLRTRRKKPFRVLTARTTNPLLEVGALPGAAAASQTLRVVLSGKAGAGAYDEKVILGLDDPDQPVLEVRVVADLK